MRALAWTPGKPGVMGGGVVLKAQEKQNLIFGFQAWGWTNMA